MIRNRRARNITNKQTSGSTSGMLLGIVGKIDWIIENPYPLTEKPEGSFLKMLQSQDSPHSPAAVPQYESCSENYLFCMK